MKLISFFVFFIVLSYSSMSQSLKGEWVGRFKDNDDNNYRIKLFFIQNKDSSYNVFSYSKGQDIYGHDTIVVCKVMYKTLNDGSIFLEETKVLKPEKVASNICLQKMNLSLYIEGNEKRLEGTWENTSKKCGLNGSISFLKK